MTGLVLVLLGLVSTGTVLSLHASTNEIKQATTRVRAYQGLEQAVAAQAYAEAGVRRAPSEVSLLRLETAIDDVDDAVDELRRVAPAADGPMLSYLVLLNDTYATETRRSVQDISQVGTDDRVAGPALDAVQDLTGASITTNRASVDAAVARQVRLVTLLSVAVPGVVLLAAGALTVAVRASQTQTKQLANSAAAAETRAITDPLTGLLNRSGFTMAATRLASDGEGTCLLLIDLDRFKTINDTHGHATGDAVLIAVADRMLEVLRPTDVLARLGGDEFAALLPGSSDGLRVAERLCEVVAQPLEADGTLLIPSISVGAAYSHNQPGAPGDAAGTTLLKAADAALYQAKADGRGRARISG